jgi:hypothetical protein
MTPLKRSVTRVSIGNGVNRKRYAVTLAPGDMIGFRDARTRKTYRTSLARCYALAVKETVAKERAAKAAAK